MLHPPDLQLPASASCGETIASKRNGRRVNIFIVKRGCIPYYLLSAKKNNGIGREPFTFLNEARIKTRKARGDRSRRSRWRSSESDKHLSLGHRGRSHRGPKLHQGPLGPRRSR